MAHIPVLLDEVVSALNPKPDQIIVDGTVGYGGHAQAVLALVQGSFTYIGLDRDPQAIQHCRSLFTSEPRIKLVHASYGDMRRVLLAEGVSGVDAILLDLGASSPQFDAQERGFSFQQDGPLDMRFDPTGEAPTAADIVNTYKEQDISDLIHEYGEERFAKKIAARIVDKRKQKPFSTTRELAELIESAIPRRLWPKTIHPATRTFQALRIAANDELNTLRKALPVMIELLNPGGRLVIISFHSLEDRLVKQAFRQASKTCLCPPEAIVCVCQHKPQLQLITKKPIIASPQEQKQNPRSRSAKLRVAEKL